MALNAAQKTRQAKALFEGVTGQKFDAVSGNTASMLKFLFPGTSDRYPIATKEAAKKLGVSPGTVRRWVRGVQNPRAEIAKKITTRVRQSMTTQRGRAQMVKRMQAQGGLPTKQRTIRIQGVQGPTADPNNWAYLRDGYSNLDMSPEEQQRFYESWVQGGDAGAEQYITGLYNSPDRYVDGWQFHGIKGISWM